MHVFWAQCNCLAGLQNAPRSACCLMSTKYGHLTKSSECPCFHPCTLCQLSSSLVCSYIIWKKTRGERTNEELHPSSGCGALPKILTKKQKRKRKTKKWRRVSSGWLWAIICGSPDLMTSHIRELEATSPPGVLFSYATGVLRWFYGFCLGESEV